MGRGRTADAETPFSVQRRPGDRQGHDTEGSIMLRGLTIAAGSFVGATAILGGFELVAGWPRQQPTEWLAGTPFDDYLVPGILLTAGVGGTSTAAAVAAARRSPHWPKRTELAGGVLAGWILAEITLLNQPNAPTITELVYLALGVSLLATGAAARHAADRSHP